VATGALGGILRSISRLSDSCLMLWVNCAMWPPRKATSGKKWFSETAAAHPRAASCGASEAPPHETGTRLS